MNQDINEQATRKNRFIFSDDYYNQLAGSDDNLDLNVTNGDSRINDFKPLQFETVTEVKVVEEKPEVVLEEVNLKDNSNNSLDNESLDKEINIPDFTQNNQINEENNPVIENINLETIQPIREIEKTEMVEIQKEEPIVEELEVEIPEKLNVETGINTSLEQEILKYKPDNIVKPPIVENTMWGENKERVKYRATRNKIPVNVNLEPVNKNDIYDSLVEKNPEKEEAFSSNNKVEVNNDNWEPVKPAPVIINDNELEKVKPKIEVKPVEVIKSDLLQQLSLKEQQTGKISILARYGDDFCSRDYITNPAIGRQEEIKQLILILLTPEKSGILVGKPGIGKTSIVEGLAYCLQRNNVPDALRGYRIVSIKAISLLGSLPTGETRLQTLIDELKELDKIILFIDETHMLMGATEESSVDFANMFKESLGRGSIKMIGATTNDEYERYVLRDKAFVRRFQRVDVLEPTKEQTVKILMGTLPKIEKNTGAKLKYTNFIQTEIMKFIVEITTEYKRVYGIGSRYPDICLTLLSQAFSQAVFDNREEVNILDIRNAILNSKNIYPDVIRKELVNFDEKFKQIINEEKAM